MDPCELEAILERAKMARSEAEYAKLHAALETLVFLTQELEKTQLPKHVEERAAYPTDSMPWNYRDRIRKLTTARSS